MEKVKYFRLIYENRKKGLAHSVHVTGERESYLMVYCCGGTEAGNPKRRPDARFTLAGEDIDLLILDGPGREACAWIGEILQRNRVRNVVCPAREESAEWLSDCGAARVTPMRDGETLRVEKAGWKTWVGCYGDRDGRSLAVLHGPEDTADGRDCLLTVKPFGRELPCSSAMRDGNHACAMRCSLYNDFDLLKRHNERPGAGCVTGTLLLGNVQLKRHGNRLFTELRKERPGGGNIRFVAPPAGGNREYWSSELLRELPKERYNRYFFFPEAARGNTGAWKEILSCSMRNRLQLLTEDYGVCAGGFISEKAE